MFWLLKYVNYLVIWWLHAVPFVLIQLLVLLFKTILLTHLCFFYKLFIIMTSPRKIGGLKLSLRTGNLLFDLFQWRECWMRVPFTFEQVEKRVFSSLVGFFMLWFSRVVFLNLIENWQFLSQSWCIIFNVDIRWWEFFVYLSSFVIYGF